MFALLELLKATDQGIVPPKPRAASSAQWLSQGQEAEWEAFVLRHPLGSIYHTNEWKRVIEEAFPHIRGRFLVLRENDSGPIYGGLPIYRVNSWLLGCRLVSVPFATACNPLVASMDDWGVLVPELERECGRTRSKKLEIHGAVSTGQFPDSFRSRSLYRHHSLRLDPDFNALHEHFDKKSVRQKTEKARRAGVIIQERNDIGGMIISHSLLATTRRRLSLPPMPSRFFEAMHGNLRAEHLKIFLAYQNGRPVACHIVLTFKDEWISEYSGSADGLISGVNQLLYFETIRQACAQGARKFSFGRTSIYNEGLLSYKRRWGTIEEKLTDFTLRRDHHNSKESQVREDAAPSEDSRLYALCKHVIAKTPLPVCKMIGDFCYRHLG
jgi:CelD/BcsL family acetyltransferase involved in cellulose biosynthesis